MPKDLFADMQQQEQPADLLAGMQQPQAEDESTLASVGKFLGSAGIGALNLPIKLGQGLAQLGLMPFGVKAPSGDISQFAPSSTGEMLGEIGAGFAIPGAGLARGGALLSRLAGAAAEGAGFGGVLGAAESDKPEDILRSAGIGGALGAGVTGALEGVGAGAGRLGRKLFGEPTRTPEQVQALREAAPEFKADIFSLTGQPRGKEAYTQVLGNIPFSGARSTMEKAVAEEDAIVNDLLGRMRGGHALEEVPEKIQEAVQKKYLENEAIKQNNYAAIDKMAEDLGVNVHNRDNLRQTADKYLNKHNKAIATNNKSALAKENEALDDLALSMAPDIEPGTGSPRTLEQSMHTWSSFGEAARRAQNEGKKYVAGMYKDLQSALEKDVDNSLEQAGGKQLKTMWDDAKKHFKENVVPFRHKGLRGIINENEPYAPDKIHQLLMNPKHRDALKLLDEQTKGQIAHQHFINNAGMNEDGEILLSSARLHNQFKKLPEDIKNILFDENDRNVLNKMAAIRDIVGEYRTQIKKPATGARTMPGMLQTGAVVGGISNPLMTAKAIGASNILNRLLTSDLLQDAYVSGSPEKLLQKLSDIMQRGGRAAQVATSKEKK